MSLAWIMRMFLKEEPKEEPKEEHKDLCPVCETHWVYDGQWYHYVKRDILYKAYERVHEHLALDHAIEGLTDECCEGCYYEDGHAGNMNELEDYILEIINGEVTA